MIKGKEAAEQSIAEFHNLYNAGHSKLKNATRESEFKDLLGTVHRKLGKLTQTSNSGFNVRTFNFTTTVVLIQNTTFEKGTGTETFNFEMQGDKAVLICLQHQFRGLDSEMKCGVSLDVQYPSTAMCILRI